MAKHPDIPGLTDWSPLARGGFATVWKARQATLDRQVAVKIDQRTLDQEKEQRRFLREAGAAGRLSGHPGIVTVHDAGILPDDRPYLVMELCPNGSLTQWMKPGQRRSQRRIRDVGVRIADALAAAHARGVLHRDVKPANILIDTYDNPGLADFGLAAIPGPDVDLSVTMEALTPAYAPREVFYQQPPNEYGDVFSLAATLYALLEGRPPRWPDEGTPSLPEILELQRQPVEPIPGVDPDLMAVILKALADDAESRPSAAEFRDQLAAVEIHDTGGEPEVPLALLVSGGDGSGSSPDTEDRNVSGKHRRNVKALILVLALVVLAALTASTVAWIRSSGPTAAPAPQVPPVSTPSDPATPTPTEAPSTPAPTEQPTSAVPAGFAACPRTMGAGAYCVTKPECWDGFSQVYDIPAVSNLTSCSRRHLYQTFMAGDLGTGVRMQSQLEGSTLARRLCSADSARRALGLARIPGNWQIQKLPPPLQLEGDELFRCIIFTGEYRSTPMTVRPLD